MIVKLMHKLKKILSELNDYKKQQIYRPTVTSNIFCLTFSAIFRENTHS